MSCSHGRNEAEKSHIRDLNASCGEVGVASVEHTVNHQVG